MTPTNASDEDLTGDLMPPPAAVVGSVGKSAVKFLGKALGHRQKTDQLEVLLRQTMYLSVLDELLDNACYEFTAQDARSSDAAIRSAVIPIVASAIRCAQAELTSRNFLRVIRDRIARKTDDLGSLSEFSAREKISGWLTGGVKAVYANGRLSTQAGAGAPPAGLAAQPWGQWWDALADPNQPVVTRAVDRFRDVVQSAADDPKGTDESRRFAQRLDDKLAINDRKRENRLKAALTAGAGGLVTAGLATAEVVAALHALLPVTLSAAGLSVVVVTWFVAQGHAAPTAAQVTELSLAVESVRDWAVNVEQSHLGDERHLLDVLERRLVPSLEGFDVAVLRATLSRVGGLLEDREARAPSYQPAKLDSAMRQLHEMVDLRPPPDDR